MTNHPQAAIRRLVGLAGGVVASLTIAYLLSPGLPVLWGPSASAAAVSTGAMLFLHEWEPNDSLAKGDGLGPVYNDRSCVACHSQGGVGGAGSSEHNVTTFEVHPTRRDPQVRTGVVHAAAVDPNDLETASLLQQQFPVIKGSRGPSVGCGPSDVPLDINPIRMQTVNSPALFGVGWIDRISSRAITANRWQNAASNIVNEFQLNWNSIPPGRARILPDGRVGKFGWKGQAATLEEFVAAACANEIGLGNPLMPQAKPLGCSAAESTVPDLDSKQFHSLVAFVDTLPRPRQVLPADPYQQDAVRRGQQVFSGIGCAICHVENIGGVKGVYSDFLLHTVDASNEPGSMPGGGYGGPDEEPLPPDFPNESEWKTPPLWGVADSAPYFHDGGSITLQDAVLRHRGDAKMVTEAFRRLSREDQSALIAFLQSLKAPADVPPYAKTVQVALRGH